MTDRITSAAITDLTNQNNFSTLMNKLTTQSPDKVVAQYKK